VHPNILNTHHCIKAIDTLQQCLDFHQTALLVVYLMGDSIKTDKGKIELPQEEERC
jgi:hypothetical protein